MFQHINNAYSLFFGKSCNFAEPVEGDVSLTEHAHFHSPKSMAACISLLQVVPQLPQQWELVPIHGNDKAQTYESGIAITNIEPYTMYQLRIPSKVQNETSKSVFKKYIKTIILCT